MLLSLFNSCRFLYFLWFIHVVSGLLSFSTRGHCCLPIDVDIVFTILFSIMFVYPQVGLIICLSNVVIKFGLPFLLQHLIILHYPLIIVELPQKVIIMKINELGSYLSSGQSREFSIRFLNRLLVVVNYYISFVKNSSI